jgi:hypothetical protein
VQCVVEAPGWDVPSGVLRRVLRVHGLCAKNIAVSLCANDDSGNTICPQEGGVHELVHAFTSHITNFVVSFLLISVKHTQEVHMVTPIIMNFESAAKENHVPPYHPQVVITPESDTHLRTSKC